MLPRITKTHVGRELKVTPCIRLGGFHSLCCPCQVLHAPRLQDGTLLIFEIRALHFGQLCLSESSHFNWRAIWDTKPGVPDFSPLAFSSTNCSFLVRSQAGCPSHVQIGHFANQNENLPLRKPGTGPSQDLSLSLLCKNWPSQIFTPLRHLPE